MEAIDMNIYLLKQKEKCGYDTYDSLVVVAEDEEAAKNILPPCCKTWEDTEYVWASSIASVTATLLGYAVTGSIAGCVLGSFNAS